MHIFAKEEELWKDILLDQWDGDFHFDTTFYKTLAKLEASKKKINCEILKPVEIKFDGLYSDILFNRWYCNQVDPTYWTGPENIDRVSNITVEEFIEKYAKPNKPCIITDIVQTY